MASAKQEVVGRVLDRLFDDEDLLNRFLGAPTEVIGEITDRPLDQAAFDAIGHGLRERFRGASELSDEQLEGVAPAAISRIGAWRPIVGRGSLWGPYTISNT